MLLAVGLHPLDRADLTKIAKLFSWVSSDFEIYMRSAKDNSGSAFGSLERISHLGEFFIGLLKLVPLQNRYVTVGLKNVALIPVYEVYCTLDLSQSEAIKDLISSKNAQLQAKDTEKNEEQYRELAIDNVPCGIPSETFLYLFPTVIRAEYCWKERDELAAGISDVHSHSPGHSEKKCVVADVFTEDEVQLADNSEMEHLPGAGKVFSSHMQDDEYAGDQGSLKPGAPEVADSGASGISERKTEMTDCSETEVAEADTPTGKPELGDTSEMRIPEAVSGGMESHMADTSGLGQSMTADIPLEDAEKADNSGEGRPEADISEGQAHAVEQLAEQDQVEDNSTDGW
ncbi:uncharacterized protein LOC101853708 [Aplysia californica]|uniref:Uncharacterized protein LOC101853708 n=1 Tax=Aplysia californica TaxID=6500 RepID=A0ABM0JVC2_APLCA|nr:uncharacterized protein LOC101853708 [Aplysia californica]